MANDRRWRVAVGADTVGLPYKDAIKADLENDGRVIELIDVGVNESDEDPSRYPTIGHAVAELVAAGKADRGLLICGTGIGMAISANQVEGVWATVAHDSYSVERSVLSNDCQVLTLGKRVVGLELARRLAKEWLDYVFDPASHSRANVALVEEYEQKRMGTSD
ncbi:MAG: RpiB/LacA/LacB family sugar-phosphate isomerase [Actinomycetota bacterium]